MFSHVPQNSRDQSHAQQFATTRWSIVLAAGQALSPESRWALASLCETYWLPVYAYARRLVWDVDDAQDLTQGFFTHLLEKDALAKADPHRGRFRAFLLTALKNYITNQRGARPSEALRILGLVILSIAVALAGSAMFGATICGAVAVGQIKHSAGKLYGLGMATVDVLLFPLLVLGSVVFTLSHLALIVIWENWPRPPPNLRADSPPAGYPGSAFMVFDAITALVVCYVVGRAVWRAVAAGQNLR